jgi:hypothetical protein
MCIDIALSGIDDVKNCLASSQKHSFPCKGMTGLSSDSVGVRSDVIRKMEEQTQQIELVSSKPLDDIKQLLTDRESELEAVRQAGVDHALMTAQVPEIMRKRAVNHAVSNGLISERWTVR